MPRTPSAIDRAIAEMPARAAAMLARLRADDKRRPFGKLDYTQYFPREVETKADGKARLEPDTGESYKRDIGARRPDGSPPPPCSKARLHEMPAVAEMEAAE